MAKPNVVKKCPKCKADMEIKTNRETGKEFLGCTGWRPGNEGCNHTEQLPESIKLRRAGQADMFDMEPQQ